MTDCRVIVITGGAGFLGEHLTRAFTASGARVRLFDSAPSPSWAAVIGAEHVQGDVRDKAALEAVTRGAEALVHAAFASPRQPSQVIRSVNIDGTANVRAVARLHRIPRVILVSSTVVTGPPRPHPFWREAPLSHLDLYRTTRMEAESIMAEASCDGLSTAIVRPQSFLGSGRLGAFGIIFELIQAGEPIPVLGQGRHRYQLLGIQDLASGIRLLTASQSRGVFAFGARTFSTVREDLRALIVHARSRSTLRFVPAGVARAGLRAIELAGFVPLSEWHRHSAWSRDSIADTARAERELGWHPERSNLDALIDAYDWYVSMIQARGEAQRTHPLPRAHRLAKRFLWALPRS